MNEYRQKDRQTDRQTESTLSVLSVNAVVISYLHLRARAQCIKCKRITPHKLKYVDQKKIRRKQKIEHNKWAMGTQTYKHLCRVREGELKRENENLSDSPDDTTTYFCVSVCCLLSMSRKLITLHNILYMTVFNVYILYVYSRYVPSVWIQRCDVMRCYTAICFRLHKLENHNDLENCQAKTKR